MYNELILTADDSSDDSPTLKNESFLEKKFVHFDDDYQRSLGGCPPPTDEPGAAKLPSGSMLLNISLGPILVKANVELATGISIHADDLIQYLPEVLDSAKLSFVRFFDFLKHH